MILLYHGVRQCLNPQNNSRLLIRSFIPLIRYIWLERDQIRWLQSYIVYIRKKKPSNN